MENCLWCGNKKFKQIAIRKDTNPVIECENCNLARIKYIPEDIYSLYGDKYFDKEGKRGIQDVGYDNYDAIPYDEFEWRMQIINFFSDTDSKRLLYIGCATGKFLEVAQKYNWESKGIEVSRYAVEIAKKKGIDVDYGTLESLNYPENFFDVITIFDVLEHIVTLREFLKEINRILKFDGYAFFLTPNAGSYRAHINGNDWIGFKYSLEHIYYFTPLTLRMVLKDVFLDEHLTIVSFERGEYDYLLGIVKNKEKAKIYKKYFRVLFVNRQHALTLPGGDTVQMIKTKEALEKLGIEIDIDLSSRPNGESYDLVHIFNTQIPDEELEQVKHLKKNYQIPIVLSPIYWDNTEKEYYSKIIKKIFNIGKRRSFDILLPKIIKDKKRSKQLSSLEKLKLEISPFLLKFREKQQNLINVVDYLLPSSYQEMEQIKASLKTSKNNFTVIPNAIDPEIFLNVSEDWFISNFKIKDFILCVGRIEDHKNQLMLIYALKDLNLPVIFIGEPNPHQKEYFKTCKEYANNSMVFINHLPQQKLASAYKAARVHILPSWFEIPGLVNLEAALCDCNIVVSDRGSTKEYFKEFAYYCDPRSVASIRDAVIKAYENYDKDKDKRNQLKEIILTKYTWDNTAKLTLEAYKKCIKKNILTL